MAKTILDLIGSTPLVELHRMNPNPKVKVMAKLEYFNPGGSIKDRAALYMIEAGEKSAELTPEKTVIEATSGNTGIGLALVCAVKGYKLMLAMSESASVERQMILKARGADILLTPGHLGTDGAIEEVYRLARENPDTYFMTDQFNNEANWKAHYYGTADEIWQETRGQVTRVVATLGTSGTLMGISRRLKERNPAVEVVGVEPYLGHKIQGLKNMKESYCPGIFEKNRLDKKINIDDEEAFEATRRLAREEGLLVGMSSGAAVAVALKEAAEMSRGTVVVILPDGGERYLSTPLFAVREKVDLKLFNSLKRAKTPFVPLRDGKVTVFTCGPTAHSRVHLSELRRFLFSDLLCRYLAYRGYDIKHVMNITDFDDKSIAGSEKASEPLSEFTRRHIDRFKRDLDELGIQPADAYPKASEHQEEMIELADRLVKKGFAYEKLRSLYFDISRYGEYGRLSGIDINKVKLGATVNLDEYEKDNPRDFTLFKRARLSELKRGIYTKSEWGNVRPSWHLQSAAISMKYCGETFDIHASSRELVFPHHENTAAIATAVTGKALAEYWLDCERVLVDGKKIDESGAALTLQDLLDMGYSGREIRFWLLSTHYRKPVLFSVDRLEDARRSLNRINHCILNLKTHAGGTPYPELNQLLYDIKQGLITGMDDDLNIAVALAALFKSVKQLNLLMREDRIDGDGAAKVLAALGRLDTVLNVLDFSDKSEEPEIRALIDERDQARKNKDWERADRIRDALLARGVTLKDEKVK